MKNAPPNAPTDRFNLIAQKYLWKPEFEGIELRGPNDAGVDGDTLLHMVVSNGELEDISYLLSIGGDVNRRGDIGNTPIHYAAMAGRTDVVKLLIEAGADANVENELGDTALSWAEACHREDTVSYLLSLNEQLE